MVRARVDRCRDKALILRDFRKTAIVLEELGLEYESIYLDFQKGEQKTAEYTKYNPNARIPALIDHSNDDFVIWYAMFGVAPLHSILIHRAAGRESNAIIMYLANKYDHEHKISASSENDKHLQFQWFCFQSSSQDSFSQAFWFARFHQEKLPSAIERYVTETLRVFGVLDGVLAKQEWLVGGKPSIVDTSFVL